MIIPNGTIVQLKIVDGLTFAPLSYWMENRYASIVAYETSYQDTVTKARFDSISMPYKVYIFGPILHGDRYTRVAREEFVVLEPTEELIAELATFVMKHG